MFAYNEEQIETNISFNRSRLVCALVFLLGTPATAFAGDFNINAGIDAKFVVQQINTKETPEQTIDSNNIVVTPYASLGYNAKDFDLFFKGTNNQIRRSLDSETTTQDFTEFNYSGNYELIDNVLSINASGLQSYTNSRANSFLVDDFLLNSESLNKLTSKSANVRLNISRGEFYGLSANSSFRKTTSELNNSNEIDDSVFDNESYSLSFDAISGTNLDGARINLTGRMAHTKRQSGQDFVSQTANLSTDIETYADFGIALNASYENNEIRTDFEVEDNGLREFYSVGAGLIWQPRSNRYIEVLWNRSTTSSLVDGEPDETNNFLSYNVNWAFSDRSSIQGGFTRRFFGDAANLAFRHNTRNWRSSVAYTEVVSSTSQLINASEVGLFVCDNGSTDIADCRLSDTLEPELEPGEVLQAFTVQNLGLNDRIIIRKSLSAQTAVTRRRTTISLSAVKSKDEEVEINRIYNISSLGANVSFAFSNKTSLQYGFSYGKTELDSDGELESAITKKHNLELRRTLSKHLTASFGLSYLDRNGEVTRGMPSLRGLNGPLSDRRITFKVSYSLAPNK